MKKNILAFIFALSFVTIFAQTSAPSYSVQLPYSCGFKKSEDLSQWVFNAGPDGVNCTDQWMVGNCDNYEGFKNSDCHAYLDNVGGGCVCSRKHHRRCNKQ